MNRAMYSGVAYLFLLGGLPAAYSGAKRLYEPQFPAELELGIRESKLGVLLYNCQQVSQGMALCRQSVIDSPDSAMAHFQLGALHNQQGMPLEAIVEFREAIRCQPDWAAAHVNLGLVLRQIGRLEDAAEEFRRAGDDPLARSNLEQTERALQRQQDQKRSPEG